MKVFVTSEESFKTMQNRKCTPSDLSPTLEDSEKYLIGMATVTEVWMLDLLSNGKTTKAALSGYSTIRRNCREA